MLRRVASAAALSVVFALSASAAAQEAPEHGVVIVPKFGFVVDGGGTEKAKCSGPGCGGGPQLSTDYDDKSGIGIGADFLATVTPNLRLGGGLLWDPDSKASAQGFSETLGNDLTLNGVIEGVFPVAPKVSLIAHGQLGILLLFPGGDLQNSIDDQKNTCAGRCDVDGGPYKSFTFGLGGGVVYQATDSIGIRADLLYQQYTSMDLVTVTAGGTSNATNISGHRFWLLLGVEFGL